MTTFPIAIHAAQAAPRVPPSSYPPAIAARLGGRIKRPLGTPFGLLNFGVNLTLLAPGAVSSMRHAHHLQDEFVYILAGRPTLRSNAGSTQLEPGMCAGFRAGSGDAHCLVNQTDDEVLYLEIGDRTAGDEVVYPDDDLKALQIDGSWQFFHRDGRPLLDPEASES